MNSPKPFARVEPQSVGLCPDRLERADALLGRYVSEGRAAGAITVVARHGKVAHRRCHGVMDLDTGEPMREDAIFRIYSMTKVVTAAAVLMLLEEGRFLLTWPVSEFIPCFADLRVQVTGADGQPEQIRPKREVTIHDLLTHTAGLSYDHVHESITAGHSLEQFVRRVCDAPLLGHPGEVWRYSEASDVLGYLVEVVSGRPFDAFLAERIFEPLGMVDTGFWVPPGKVDRLAAIYTDGEGGRLVPATDLHADTFTSRPSLPSGGGGLVSTTDDYLRFAQMLLNGGVLDGVRLLGPKTIELMADNHLPAGHPPLDVNQRGYGLGVAATGRPGESLTLSSVGEFGWGGAAGTNVWIDPVENMVTLMMVQHRPVRTFKLSELFKHTVYQAIIDSRSAYRSSVEPSGPRA
jgi:CubicO group peptidase (beta-lactamase class C family)